MNNKGIRNVGLVSENRGYVVLSQKYISTVAQSLWMQTTQHKRDLKPNRTPLTAPFITPCYLILKEYFPLIILWSSVQIPQGNNMLPTFISPAGQSLGGSALLSGTSHSVGLGLPSWRTASAHCHSAKLFDLKRVFLINIYHACFSHFGASDWTWLIHEGTIQNPEVLL